MNRSDFLTLATSVSGNSSAANVYFANDGLNIYFFTFNPTRKATQIAFNPHVQCVIRPENEEGIKELQIDGFAEKITDNHKKEKAKQLILNGRKNKVLNNKINLKIPITLFHGLKDGVVPIKFSKEIFKTCKKAQKRMIKIKNGDHSLSRKNDLKKICKELNVMILNHF